MPSFESMQAGYRNLWSKAEITPSQRDELERAVGRIIDGKQRYQWVEEKTKVPWHWVGCTHYRESASSFDGVLHNGQDIIGKGTKTTWVPKGRGPFDTWEESAIDAVNLKELHKVPEWSVERALYEFERYNGWGYNGRINSPYVWAKTNLQQRGKYIADGEYSASTWDAQPGTAALLKVLAEKDESVAGWIAGESMPPEDSSVVVPPPSVEALGQYTTDALIAELLERPNVADVQIIYNRANK